MSAPDDNSFSLPPLRWGLAGLRSEAAPKLRWLWHGYLAVGAVTLLTSQWKIGKTTLLSILLARMKTGGTLAGLPVSAGRAVVISEESSEQWLLRGRRLNLDGCKEPLGRQLIHRTEVISPAGSARCARSPPPVTGLSE